MKRYLCIILILVLSTIVMNGSSNHRERFCDIFDLSIIVKSEVSRFKENHFQPIDNEAFLDAIKSSKEIVAKFIPHKEVILYDENGNSFKLFFLEDNRIFHSDDGYFKLSKRNALLVSKLFKEVDPGLLYGEFYSIVQRFET